MNLQLVVLLILTFTSINHSQFKINKRMNSKISLKVLLVEFQDVKHRNPNYPINLSLPAYTFDDFNNMLFSIDTYYSPNMYSPDLDYVFGSLRDYYRTMSNNNFDIDGKILNNDFDRDNIPDWILLDSTKYFYNQNGPKFIQDALLRADLQGLDIGTNDTTFLLLIYAGHTYRGGSNSLTPKALKKNHLYTMGERFVADKPYCEERDDPSLGLISQFAHIGIHAHEFGHLLGFEDHDGGKDNEYWSLMSKGCFNGVKFDGACPAPINPYLRIKMGWIRFDSLKTNSRAEIKYNIKDPEVIKIQDAESNSFFLIEFRKFDAQLKLGNGYSKDFNSNIMNVSMESGVLVWRKLDGDFVKLIYSGGENCTQPNKHFFPGYCIVNVLSPWSDNRPRQMGYYWVPNTKPSLNCGLEIISLEKDAAIIDLYIKDPWLASPSKPKNVSVLSGEVDAAFKWENNTEPDLNYYRVYKKKDNSKYILYDSCEFNKYTDVLETIDTVSNDRIIVCYKITAVDSSIKESTCSQEIFFEVGNNSTGLANNKNDIIKKYSLYQNYPNPFNPYTKIKYTIPLNLAYRQVCEKGEILEVRLAVYNVLGKELKVLVSEKQIPGDYEIEFDGSNFSSGAYFYKLQVYTPGRARDFVDTKKMILLR